MARILQFRPQREDTRKLDFVDACLWFSIALCIVLVVAIARYMVLDVLSVL